MMSIVMDVRLFFTIAIDVRWLHIVITKGDTAPPIRRKNRAPHILIIVVVVSLFLSSLSSYPHYSRSILWRILVVLFVVVVLYPHRRHISIVHLEDLVKVSHLEASCTSTLTTFAYGTLQRSRPFANGKNRGVFSLGLKPFVNGSCTQTGGNMNI